MKTYFFQPHYFSYYYDKTIDINNKCFEIISLHIRIYFYIYIIGNNDFQFFT